MKKIDDLEKRSSVNEAYLEELKNDKTNVEFYKTEIRKRDDHIRFIIDFSKFFN